MGGLNKSQAFRVFIEFLMGLKFFGIILLIHGDTHVNVAHLAEGKEANLLIELSFMEIEDPDMQMVLLD